MNKRIEIRHKGVSVNITKHQAIKKGVEYTEYVVRDYSSGRLVRHVRAKLEEAKAKARDVAESLATGHQTERMMIVNDDLRADVRRAIKLLEPLGVDLYSATKRLVDAVAVLDGKLDDLIVAASF